METSGDRQSLSERLARFSPENSARPRSLAWFSASIARSDDALMAGAMNKAREHGATVNDLYEIVLQSYLFLGFPRMLEAADVWCRVFPDGCSDRAPRETGEEFAAEWSRRGLDLCQDVYRENFERLQTRVNDMAPEIFDWMVLEGYGKVLSRPGLDIQTRELAIVACLMIDNRPRQLQSHLRGALNVGVSGELLTTVVADLGEAAGAGYRAARDILAKLKVTR